MTRLISILTILIFSCSYSRTNNKNATQVTHFENKVDSLQTDTLRDPNHFYYLTDLPLRDVALLILKDSIEPSDNKITFDCMDSVSSTDAIARDFYFPVFLKIIDKADGALAEVVGQYTMTYIEKYPKEFADKSNNITKEQFESWASNTGYELYFTYETTKKAKQWTNSILKKCSDCDTTQLKRLENFNKLAISAMKDDDEN